MRTCIVCGRVICEDSAAFYKPPLSDMCKQHRQEELMKTQKEKRAAEAAERK